MKCHLHKKKIVVAVFLLIGVFYLINHPSDVTADLIAPAVHAANDLVWMADRPVSKESWLAQGGFLHFNVSYQLLAGAPSAQQKYLAIGLSSIKRKKGSYLSPTLKSIFSQSSPGDQASMVVVVLLADFDLSWRVVTVKKIKTEFPMELDQGKLLVIHVPQDWYPPITGLKRNFNDAPDRVTYRSKQNVDYSFLIHYSAGLGRYYLQLEDDVTCAKNFFTTIKKRVEEQEAKKTVWATLEFSSLGYIGKLYKSVHLPLLARFLFLFYQEMPCDWLLSHFRQVMIQREPILFKPSLFQHMGTFSSFQGRYNKLKDKDFEEDFYSNPLAKVYSNMSIYKEHFPHLAWNAGEEFFWGRSPEKGNYFTVVFSDPAMVAGILVETGLEGKDLLESALVELGHDKVITEKGESCKMFQSIGVIRNGRFEMQEIDIHHPSASECLRIQVTADQNDWVIIRKVRITTK